MIFLNRGRSLFTSYNQGITYLKLHHRVQDPTGLPVIIEKEHEMLLSNDGTRGLPITYDDDVITLNFTIYMIKRILSDETRIKLVNGRRGIHELKERRVFKQLGIKEYLN